MNTFPSVYQMATCTNTLKKFTENCCLLGPSSIKNGDGGSTSVRTAGASRKRGPRQASVGDESGPIPREAITQRQLNLWETGLWGSTTQEEVSHCPQSPLPDYLTFQRLVVLVSRHEHLSHEGLAVPGHVPDSGAVRRNRAPAEHLQLAFLCEQGEGGLAVLVVRLVQEHDPRGVAPERRQVHALLVPAKEQTPGRGT